VEKVEKWLEEIDSEGLKKILKIFSKLVTDNMFAKRCFSLLVSDAIIAVDPSLAVTPSLFVKLSEIPAEIEVRSCGMSPFGETHT
jgi:hypothetical protein